MFLIHEIISVASPILFEEIEMCLLALEVTFDSKSVSRSIYLLSKLNLINSYIYSSFKFYYPSSEQRRAKLPHSKGKKIRDRNVV